MADTTILLLPLIAASQAQKHITHNEALAKLDVIVQLTVYDRTLTAPPGAPVLGDRHIVGASATGAWATHDGQIAFYDGTIWLFTVPLTGFQAYVIAEERMVVFDGATWVYPTAFTVQTQVASYATISADFLGNRLVEMDVATANTLTVDPGMVNGEPLEVAQKGAGQTTITAGAGVTLLAAGGALKLRVQNSVCKIARVGANTYRVWGDLVV